MKSLRSGGRFLLRLEKGDEILDAVKAIARAQKIPGATLSGIGAASEMTVAFWDVEARLYRNYEHRGLIEITSLAGNLAWLEDSPVVHLHVSAFEESEGAFGGHLVSGVVSATVEIAIDPFEDRILRRRDEKVGLPLLDLPKSPKG